MKTFFKTFEEKVLDQNRSYIDTFWDKSEKCLSVSNSGILSAVICYPHMSCAAYTSLCRGLEYSSLKVRYIIVVDSVQDGFLIFDTVFLGMSEKLNTKWAALAFGSKYLHQTFTECVSNQKTHFDISTYQMYCKLWNVLWLYCVFGYFHTLLMTINVWIVVSRPKFHWSYL